MIDRDLELKILRFFLQDFNLYREVPTDFFASDDARIFYSFLKDYLRTYHALPTSQVILESADDQVKIIYSEISAIDVSLSEYSYYSQRMYENYVDRKMYDIASLISNGLLISNGEELRQKVVGKISSIHNPFTEVGAIQRRFVWEGAKERWEIYKQVEKNPDLRKGIPWGIDAFDDITHGAHPSWLICFFSQSKVGKTTAMANLAFNQAVLSGADVMWVAREMSLEDMERVFDSRFTLLERNALRDATLTVEQRRKYLQHLKTFTREKPSLYIVDIPSQCSPIAIENELLIYRDKRGKFPQVVYLDYANLMIPSKKYSNTSERYNFLFEELHELARKYRICLVTAVQEGRTGMKVKSKEEVGVEHIGLSHYIVPHVELMIHLFQDTLDGYLKVLRWSIKASRHTASDRTFSTFAFFEMAYIGDRKIKQVEEFKNARSNS